MFRKFLTILCLKNADISALSLELDIQRQKINHKEKRVSDLSLPGVNRHNVVW